MRLILSLLFIILLAVAPSANAQINKPDSARYETKIDSTVYITRHGKAYHRANCRFLSKSKIPLPLSEAKKYYTPCKICKPPE